MPKFVPSFPNSPPSLSLSFSKKWLFLLLLFAFMFLGNSSSAFSNTPTLREKRTPHFLFQYPERWSSVASFLWKKSEEDLAVMEKKLGFSLNSVLTVRLASSGQAFDAIQPEHWHPKHWIAGLAYPQKGLMTLKIRPVDGLDGIHQTFLHELNHLLLFLAAHRQKLPLWFVEATAMIFSDDIGSFERSLLLSQAQLFGLIPDINSLSVSFPSNHHDAQIAYAVSCDFLLFLQSRHPDIIPQILAEIRRGSSFKEALEKKTKLPFSSLTQIWQESLHSRYSWLLLLAHPTLLWMLASLFFLFIFLKLKRQRRRELDELPDDDPSLDNDDFHPFRPSSPQLPDGQKIFPDERK